MAHDLQNIIIEALPRDASPMVNRAIRALASQRIGREVSASEYAAAIVNLENDGLVVRIRGGQSGRLKRAKAEALSSSAISEWTEPRLQPCIGRYLRTRFWREFKPALPPKTYWRVLDTSTGGLSEQWSRPDYTVVCIRPRTICDRAEVEVLTFELKAENAADRKATSQAREQKRMAHFGYLVWHVPKGSQREKEIEHRRSDCQRNGIGLIIVRDPDHVDTWEVRLQAVRSDPDKGEVEALLQANLERDEIEKIKALLAG